MIFVDLHGVLVDFVSQCNTTFDVDVYGDPKHHGDWHAPKAVIEEFAARVSSQDAEFWSEMPLLPTAFELLNGLEDAIILTTPWGNAASFAGTKALIERHFPATPYIFSTQKHVLALGNTLIDDKEENIEAWNKHGGKGILYPGLMNRLHNEVD